MSWVVWIEASLLLHEEIAHSLLVFNNNLLLALNVGTISVVHAEQVLQLVLIHILCGAVFPHEE